MKKTVQLLALTGLMSASTASFSAISNGQDYGDWKGVCEGGECAVVQVVSNQENTPVGRVVLRKMNVPQAGSSTVMIITVPLGVNLHAGAGLAIDGTELRRAQFDFCDQGGCNLAMPLEGDTLTKIKKGNTLQVAAFVNDQQQTLAFSLKGVTKAIDAL